jgi:signal transduction histidine kinase
MRALDQGAAAFGDGKLDSRVVVSGRSPIRELTSTFNSMAVRIKALISAQKELTDSVSHELRTPIARLRFGMFRLENCNSHDDWQVAMDGMREDVDELDQLVDELLTFSRLKSADPNVSVQEVQVEPWLSQVTSNIEGVKENVEITSQLDTGLETVAFDPRLMARALSNLIRNAIRYARTSVKVTVQRGSEGVQLIVEDDGDGISDEHFERVFEPFVRVESRHSGESTGYGLGLAIVKRICDWHSAKVSAATSSMGGAKFVIHVGDQIDRSYAN